MNNKSAKLFVTVRCCRTKWIYQQTMKIQGFWVVLSFSYRNNIIIIFPATFCRVLQPFLSTRKVKNANFTIIYLWPQNSQSSMYHHEIDIVMLGNDNSIIDMLCGAPRQVFWHYYLPSNIYIANYCRMYIFCDIRPRAYT